jgi:hypothetical protein
LLGGDDDEDGNGGRSSETEEDDADDDEKKNSDDSDDENDAGFKRAAWGKGNAISAKNRFGDKSFSKKRVGANGDMEVTFHSGLEELSVRMKDRKDEVRISQILTRCLPPPRECTAAVTLLATVTTTYSTSALFYL